MHHRSTSIGIFEIKQQEVELLPDTLKIVARSLDGLSLNYLKQPRRNPWIYHRWGHLHGLVFQCPPFPMWPHLDFAMGPIGGQWLAYRDCPRFTRCLVNAAGPFATFMRRWPDICQKELWNSHSAFSMVWTFARVMDINRLGMGMMLWGDLVPRYFLNFWRLSNTWCNQTGGG